MKHKILASLFLALLCASSAFAETYSLIGDRYLRRYTADTATPVYNASVDAALIAEDLCKVPWAHSDVTQAVHTTHTDSLLDSNIANRESFDAASFCARHTNSTHWAYANAAVYRYELPDGTLPKLTNLAVRVFSDPYQRYGARIVLLTNSTGEIPTDCATVRGNVVGSIVATNVAHRLAYSINSEIKWYPAYSNLVFSTAQLGASGLQLQKYLFVFVLKENYAYVNGNWIEGSSYIQNKIEIMTDAAIPTWTDGATVNLAVVSAASSDDGETSDTDSTSLDGERDANDVTEATKSPWYGKMVCYEDDMTVVKCTDAQTNVQYFAAPPVAYRRLHRYGTNLTSVTHAAFKYGTAWALGPATNVSASSGLTIVSVYPHQAVKLLHRAARDSRGYEYLPTLVDMTNSDVRLVADYAAAFGLGSSYFDTVTNLAATTRAPLGWILYTGATSAADTDGDGLDLVHEWDNGIYPTDPLSVDTDGDTIHDGYAQRYFLKGTDAREDFDGDGLSNYAEYLITEVFDFADCDPLVSVTPDSTSANDGAPDYFKKVGELYLGEMFSDHDRVSDAWERKYAKAGSDGVVRPNANVYDADDDQDGDGWSNWSEAQAGTNPWLDYSQSLGATLPEFPIPAIRANLTYGGARVLTGDFHFKAWSEKRDAEMLTSPDAVWSSSSDASNTVKYIGRNPGKEVTCCLGTGTIKPSTLKVYFRDILTEKVTLRGGVEVSSVIATDVSKWYYFIDDAGDGILRTVAATNSIVANSEGQIEVGTVDYDSGMVTIDFSKLPDAYYELTGNGEGSNDTTDKSQAVNYNLFKVNLASSYVRLAWTPAKVNTTGNGTVYLSDSVGITSTARGHIREGLNSFLVWADLEGGESGVFDPGEPFGFVQHVDVGWQGAELDIELSEMSAITPRFNIWGDSSVSDRGQTVDEDVKQRLTDRTIENMGNLTEALKAQLAVMTNHAQNVNAENPRVHVSVVRWGVNDKFAYLLGVGFGDTDPDPIVIDRTYDSSGRSFICEADFLQNGEFDIDWSRMKDEIADDGDGVNGVIGGVGDVTNMTYLAVLEGGNGYAYWVRGSWDTNTTIRALQTTIERRFESWADFTRADNVPVAQAVGGICYGARPTFKWTLPNEAAYAKKYGTSYTAFQLEVYEQTEAGGMGRKVYESGTRRMPAPDADGVFSWTADLSVGDLTSLGEEFLATGNYCWRVAVYNAKFKPGETGPAYFGSLSCDRWSVAKPFSTAVNSQQPINAFGYSAIDVAVKYAGSEKVYANLAKNMHYMDISCTNGKIRVQAFATADFAGAPLSEAIVTKGVEGLTDLSANVTLKGLPATGTYYLRAYIDSNGNHQLDDWESWGAAATPVALTTATVTSPLATVWIEDSDTDGDWAPDALEYAEYRSLTNYTANVKSENATLFSATSFNTSTGRLASVSTTLEDTPLVIFENGTWAVDELDWGDDDGEITYDDIRTAIRTRLNSISSSVGN